ncbi:MAG: fluoride efflux transporter CrcB [Candidatus Obscuribacterales bacterium]|nr:fluoride efflux transporter CrcB [Candidatus Obscuribacterales bacterium]
MSFLLIFLGSGFGGVCRYLLSTTVQRFANGWIFPIGTFSVNMLGCLLIGFLAQLSEARGLFPGDQRLFLFVGILGGFTTFSSFGYETVQLIRDGEFLYAAGNAVLQVALGLICVWLGYVLGRLV